jgi:hypothetical protein
VVDEDLPKTVAAVLRGRLKLHEAAFLPMAMTNIRWQKSMSLLLWQTGFSTY